MVRRHVAVARCRSVPSMSRRGAVREYVGGALWVLPTIAVVVSLVAGAVLAQFEVDSDTGFGRLLFQGDASAARELLIVVSATMITVTGLVFSLTVVALQISSTQFSPRLLRSFLRDRGTQVVLSIFVSTFAYATAGLYTVGRLEGGQPYVPRIAISGSLLLALGSVAAFVWYLHHLAHSIQIDDVMRRIEEATLHVIARSTGGRATNDEPLTDPPPGATAVASPTSGYVQAAFPDEVAEQAARSGAVVRYCCTVGDHVVAGSPIGYVWTENGTIDTRDRREPCRSGHAHRLRANIRARRSVRRPSARRYRPARHVASDQRPIHRRPVDPTRHRRADVRRCPTSRVRASGATKRARLVYYSRCRLSLTYSTWRADNSVVWPPMNHK